MDGLHVAYLPSSAGWLLPLIARVNASSSARIQTAAAAWKDSELSELGLAITTKLAILPIPIARADKLMAELGDAIERVTDLDDYLSKGAGFLRERPELIYEILEALEAFIYECRSAYEISGKFVNQFYAHILGRKIKEAEIHAILESAGIPMEWVRDLADRRIEFFHNTAPWLAVRIHSRDPLRAEVLLLRRKVRDLADSGDVIPMSRLRAMRDGFYSAISALGEHLSNEIPMSD